MVERKTTRTYKVDGDDYVAIKRDEFQSGKGKNVVQIVEEHGITMEEIEDVIKNLAPEEMAAVKGELDKTKNEMKEISDEIKDKINTREYKQFKKQLETEEYQEFMNILGRERALRSAESRVKELEQTINDVLAWEEQFKDLKSEIELHL